MSALSYAAPSGPHPVGVRDGEFTDTAYPTLRSGDADGRRMMVRVWYPAATADGQRRPYFTDAEVGVVGSGMTGEPPRPPVSWLARLGEVTTHSLMEAPAATGRFPVLVFSHGASGYVGQNTPLMEHLASSGYVVWDLAHPGETGGVIYPNGDIVLSDAEFDDALNALGADPSTMDRLGTDIGKRLAAAGQQVDDRAMGPWSRRWVDDTRALLDALEGSSVSGIPREVLAACDLDRIGVFGMSFGGAAAASAAQVDHRVRAVVNLDGGQYLSDLLDHDIRLPLLELTSDSAAYFTRLGVPAHFLAYNEFFYEPVASAGLREDVVRLRIPDVTHIELTDLLLFPANERATALPGGAGAADGPRTIALVNTFIGGYFDAVLKGDLNGFPKAQLDEYPEVQRIDLTPLREWSAGTKTAS